MSKRDEELSDCEKNAEALRTIEKRLAAAIDKLHKYVEDSPTKKASSVKKTKRLKKLAEKDLAIDKED